MRLKILDLKKETPVEIQKRIFDLIWDEWGDHYNSKNELKSEIDHCVRRDTSSKIFYAEDKNNNILGTVSFLQNDLDLFPEINSWIANFYVVKNHRDQGIGRMLYKKVIEYAHSLGHKSLYLYTTDTLYYKNKGWEVVKNFTYKEKDHFLMRLDISKLTLSS